MATCPATGKISHASEGAAWAAIAALRRVGRGNPHYRAYRCGDHWHIGHSRESLDLAIKGARQAQRFASRQIRRRRKR